ncbi:hypothetical protein BSKO_09407 [Bryopsis sp. KO-2023]|nr:hypothetical protein BSKO_09407 [Bryopsis sp. KO-2023]
MEGEEVPEEIKGFIDEHRPHFSWLAKEGKVKCELNGHEFRPRLDQLNTFARGKKFHQLKVKQAGMDVIQKANRFIGPSKNFSDKMYCKLTGSLIDCDAKMAIKHMEGKKFKKRKAKLDADPDNFQFTDEPNLSDVERQLREEASDSSTDLFAPVDPATGEGKPKSEKNNEKSENPEGSSERKGKRGKSKRKEESCGEDVTMEDELMADIQDTIVKLKETGVKRKTKLKKRKAKMARRE